MPALVEPRGGEAFAAERGFPAIFSSAIIVSRTDDNGFRETVSRHDAVVTATAHPQRELRRACGMGAAHRRHPQRDHGRCRSRRARLESGAGTGTLVSHSHKLPMAIDRLPVEAQLIARRLKEALALERIYLFGSHARGNGGRDSDLDFLVVVPHSGKSRYERAIEAYRAGCRHRVSERPHRAHARGMGERNQSSLLPLQHCAEGGHCSSP